MEQMHMLISWIPFILQGYAHTLSKRDGLSHRARENYQNPRYDPVKMPGMSFSLQSPNCSLFCKLSIHSVLCSFLCSLSRVSIELREMMVCTQAQASGLFPQVHSFPQLDEVVALKHLSLCQWGVQGQPCRGFWQHLGWSAGGGPATQGSSCR